MTAFTVVVAGMPQMADALERTGQFAHVFAVASTNGLRELLASRQLSGGAADKVFLFSDATPVDTQQSLEFLIQRMTAMKARVVVVATSPAGKDIVRQCPGAGLLEGLVKVNTLMGGLAAMDVPVAPVPEAENYDIDLAVDAGPLQTAAGNLAGNPFAKPAAAAPVPDVAPSPEPTAPAGPANPFADTAAPANPFASSAPAGNPFTAEPAAAPAAKPAGGNPFAATSSPEPASPFASPVPTGNPFTTEPTATQPPTAGNPFGQASAPAPEPAAGTPFAVTAPSPAAGNPFAHAAAAEPAPGNPFGHASAPAAPGNPFAHAAEAPAGGPFSPETGSSQPAAASPFPDPAAADNPFANAPAAPVTDNPFSQPPAGAAFPDPAVSPAPAGPMRPQIRVGAEPAAPRKRRGLVITVTAPKGGTGKSSLTLNTAAYMGLRLQGSGKNVAVIDANVQQADAGKYLDQWSPNIEDVLRDTSAIHPDRIGHYLLHRPELNLSVLLGPMSPEVAHPMYFSGKKYSQILEAMRPNFDYIFIDTPVAEFYHDIFREFALPQADFVMVAITPNYTTLMNTDAWLRQICAPKQSRGMGFDPSHVGVVLNRAEEDIGFSEEEVIRDLGAWPYLGAIPETKEWKKANNEGKLVATRNFHELNDAFNNILLQITGEELLATTPVNLAPTRDNLMGKVKNALIKFSKGKSNG